MFPMMEKAYIILAHKNPSQLYRLLSRLDDNASTFFVHIDKQVSLHDFSSLSDFGNKINYVKRVKSSWASFELVEATLNALNAIKASKQQFDTIVLLSGQDYPIKSNEIINDYFHTSKYSVFIEYFPIPNYKRWQNRGGAFRLDKYFFGFKFHQRFTAKALNFLANFFPFLTRRLPNNLVPYGGSQWWTIDIYALEYILDYVEKNPAYVSFHKATFAPDEIFFQTILLNTKDEKLLRSIINNNKRYMIFKDRTQHPEILTNENYKDLVISNALYARKFDYSIDTEILDLIDNACLSKVNEQGKLERNY